MLGLSDRPLRGARVAATVGLFVHGMLLASWAPRIPEVKSSLGLSDGQLGMALLGPPTGSVVTLWAVGRLVGRLGSGPVVQVFLVAYCGAGLLVAAAGGLATLTLTLTGWGIAASGLGLAVNAQAVAVERGYGRPIMSTVHAAWSVGALVGAGCGVAAAAADVSLGVQLAVVGAAGLAVALPASRLMLSPGHDVDPNPRPVVGQRPRQASGIARRRLAALTPDTFCRSLTILTSRSQPLLSAGTRKSVVKRR